MVRTVDLVVSSHLGACTAAIDALQRGQRVLVVVRSSDVRAGRRLRRCLCRMARAEGSQVTVITGAEVVCVDGVVGVEAVVIRYVRTGRLCAVNASAFASDAESGSVRIQCVIA
jgi:thioredoxin reductase